MYTCGGYAQSGLLSPIILFLYCFLVFVMAFLPLLFFLVYANLYFCRL